MEKITFNVESESTGELYAVEAWRSDRGVHLTCTCAAGQANQLCKHRLRVLEQNEVATVARASGDLSDFLALIQGSHIPVAREKIAALEAQIANAQAELKTLKKQLGKMLNDGDSSSHTTG